MSLTTPYTVKLINPFYTNIKRPLFQSLRHLSTLPQNRKPASAHAKQQPKTLPKTSLVTPVLNPLPPVLTTGSLPAKHAVSKIIWGRSIATPLKQKKIRPFPKKVIIRVPRPKRVLKDSFLPQQDPTPIKRPKKRKWAFPFAPLGNNSRNKTLLSLFPKPAVRPLKRPGKWKELTRKQRHSKLMDEQKRLAKALVWVNRRTRVHYNQKYARFLFKKRSIVRRCFKTKGAPARRVLVRAPKRIFRKKNKNKWKSKPPVFPDRGKLQSKRLEKRVFKKVIRKEKIARYFQRCGRKVFRRKLPYRRAKKTRKETFGQPAYAGWGATYFYGVPTVNLSYRKRFSTIRPIKPALCFASFFLTLTREHLENKPAPRAHLIGRTKLQTSGGKNLSFLYRQIYAPRIEIGFKQLRLRTRKRRATEWNKKRTLWFKRKRFLRRNFYRRKRGFLRNQRPFFLKRVASKRARKLIIARSFTKKYEWVSRKRRGSTVLPRVGLFPFDKTPRTGFLTFQDPMLMLRERAVRALLLQARDITFSQNDRTEIEYEREECSIKKECDWGRIWASLHPALFKPTLGRQAKWKTGFLSNPRRKYRHGISINSRPLLTTRKTLETQPKITLERYYQKNQSPESQFKRHGRAAETKKEMEKNRFSGIKRHRRLSMYKMRMRYCRRAFVAEMGSRGCSLEETWRWTDEWNRRESQRNISHIGFSQQKSIRRRQKRQLYGCFFKLRGTHYELKPKRSKKKPRYKLRRKAKRRYPLGTPRPKQKFSIIKKRALRTRLGKAVKQFLKARRRITRWRRKRVVIGAASKEAKPGQRVLARKTQYSIKTKRYARYNKIKTKRRARHNKMTIKRRARAPRYGQQRIIWPVGIVKRRELRPSRKASHFFRSTGQITASRSYFRTRGKLERLSEASKYLDKKLREDRLRVKSITPYYALHYKLKARRWHTPRDINGVPIARPELSNSVKNDRVQEKDRRFWEKQRFNREAWAAKNDPQKRAQLEKQANSKALWAPKFPDHSWRTLEIKVGYPATLGYAHQQRIVRNNFITNRWWQPIALPTPNRHPFSFVPDQLQPYSFFSNSKHDLYYTNIDFYRTAVYTARSRQFGGVVCEKTSTDIHFKRAKRQIYTIRGAAKNCKQKLSNYPLGVDWRHYCKKRTDPKAHAILRRIVGGSTKKNWLSERRIEKIIRSYPDWYWKQIMYEPRIASTRQQLGYEPARIVAFLIEQSRQLLFKEYPNWWVEEARLRLPVLKKQIERLDLTRKTIARCKPRTIKNAARFPSVQFYKKYRKELARLRESKPKRVRTTNTLEKLYDLKEDLKLKKFGQIRETTALFHQQKQFRFRSFLPKEVLELFPQIFSFDRLSKNRGLAYQRWARQKSINEKNTRIRHSSYKHEELQKKTIYALPCERTNFPGRGNRFLSYSRALRVHYRKVRRSRFRQINTLRYTLVQPKLTLDSRFSERKFSANLTFRLKRRAGALLTKNRYLTKNWRLLAIKRSKRIKNQALPNTNSFASGRRTVAGKRRFGLAPINFNFDEMKYQQASLDSQISLGHVAYVRNVLGYALNTREFDRKLINRESALDSRLLPVEQVLPARRARRIEKEEEQDSASPYDSNSFGNGSKSDTIVREKINSFTQNGFYLLTTATSWRPYTFSPVTETGEKLTITKKVTRESWAEAGYTRRSRSRRAYIKQLSSARQERNKLGLQRRFVRLLKPNFFGQKIQFIHKNETRNRKRRMYSLNTRRKTQTRRQLKMLIICKTKKHKQLQAQKNYRRGSFTLSTTRVLTAWRLPYNRKKKQYRVFRRSQRSRPRPRAIRRLNSPTTVVFVHTLKQKPMGRHNLYAKGCWNLPQKVTKIERNVLATKRFSQRLLNNLGQAEVLTPRSFKRKICTINRSSVRQKNEDHIRARVNHASYQRTSEVITATTTFFPQLISWLRKHLRTPETKTYQDAEGRVGAVYWSLRFHLSQDITGSRIDFKDRSLPYREAVNEEITAGAQTTIFSKQDKKLISERRQPTRITRKKNQRMASLGWLRFWFPRLYKFHLEDNNYYDSFTFTPPDAQLIRPNFGHVSTWAVQPFKTDATLSLTRRLELGEDKKTPTYENMLKTTRRKGSLLQDAIVSTGAQNRRTKLMLYPVKNFFTKQFSTQARPSSASANSDLLLERLATQRRFSPVAAGRLSFQIYSVGYARKKAQLNAQARLGSAPLKDQDLVGFIDPRAARAKSPRNASYVQRRIEKATYFTRHDRYLRHLKRVRGRRVDPVTPLPPVGFNSRRVVLSTNFTHKKENAIAPRPRPLISRRRAPTFITSRLVQARPLATYKIHAKFRIKQWIHGVSRSTENFRMYQDVEKQYGSFFDNSHKKAGTEVNCFRSILQFRAAHSRLQPVIRNYQPKVPRDVRVLLKSGTQSGVNRKRFKLRHWFNLSKMHRKQFDKNVLIQKRALINLGHLEPGSIPSRNEITFSIEDAIELRRSLSASFAPSPSFQLQSRARKPQYASNRNLRKNFRIFTVIPKHARKCASIAYEKERLANRENVLSDARRNFWMRLTSRFFLKSRRLKNWIKDMKRYMLRSRWKEIPEVIFKEVRTRARLFEWKESDEHFFRRGWKNAFTLYPSERARAPWLQPIRRRRTAYSTRLGEYRRYAFPREQKRLKARQHYRKARVTPDSRQPYVKGRRWPRLRTTAYRLARSLFEFRNTRTAQKHFKKLSKWKTKTTGFSRNLIGLGNRLDVNLRLLGLFKTVYWTRQFAGCGLVKVNDKIVDKANYRLHPGDRLEFDWEKIQQAQEVFKLDRHHSTFEDISHFFKLQQRPGNFTWHSGHKYLIYERLPTPEDISDSTRLCRWLFDAFRRDAGIGRR